MKICKKCRKEIGQSESQFEHRLRNDYGGRYYDYYHYSCWDEKKEEEKREAKEQKQEEQKRRKEALEEELNQINSESLAITNRMMATLGNPSVDDVKEINKFKNKQKKFLKKVEKVDIDGKKDLKEDLESLDNFLEEHASPQLQDKASSNSKRQRKGKKKCFHENIEKYEDESRYYCSYCWEDNSAEFLQKLEAKGLKQGEKKEPSDSNLPVPKHHKHKDNSDSNTEREREREQIQSEIRDLEQKTNRTPEEKAELDQKRKQLEQLDNDTDVPAKANANEPFNWTPWIIGGLVLVAVIGIGFYLISKKGKDKYAV